MTTRPAFMTALLIACASICGCQTGQSDVRMVASEAPRCSPTPSKEFQAALANLHDTLRRELGARPEVTYDAIFEEASSILDRRAGNHKALLHTEALRILCTTPTITLPDTRSLTLVVPVDQLDLDELSKALTSGEYGALTLSAGLSLITAWEPVRVAHMTRNMILSRAFGPEDMARRHILDTLAPLRARIVNPDPDAPEVALVGGDEIFTVALNYVKDKGIYVPVRVGWWRRP